MTGVPASRLRRWWAEPHLLHHLALDRVLRQQDDQEVAQVDLAGDLDAPVDADRHLDVDEDLVVGALELGVQESSERGVGLGAAPVRDEDPPLLAAHDRLPTRSPSIIPPSYTGRVRVETRC